MRRLLPVLAITFCVAFAASAQKVKKGTLQVTVITEDSTAVQGATVTLYTSNEDYTNSANQVGQMTTNKKGQAKFKKIPVKEYFVDARKDAMKNDGLAVKTEPIEKKKVNKATTIIQ